MKRFVAYYPMLAALAAAWFVLLAPLRAAETDERIETAFKQSYVYKVYLKDDDVKIAANAGVVTLRGTVADASLKTLAHDTAAGLPGVTRVDNQLVTKAQAAADNADTWIARKVKLTLLFHRHVDAGATKVTVENGVVILEGVAATMKQKELTTEYARDVDDVKDVKNLMVVASVPPPAQQTLAEKLDDASITGQVKLALLTHRSTRSVKATVTTHDGVVTVTGVANGVAEKEQVTRIVADIKGVTALKNEMTTGPAKAE